MKWQAICLAVAGIAGGAAFAKVEPSEPATTRSATTSPATTAAAIVNDPKLEALIAQLGDDDWRKRESATKEIVKLGPPAKPRLGQLVVETKDEEVRTRAASAIAQIDDNKLIGPSIITIQGKGMTADKAFAELSRQGDAPAYTTSPPNMLKDKSLKPADLDLKGVSYFEALETLCEKYGVYVQDYGDSMRLNRGRNHGQTDGLKAASGPFMLSCNYLNRSLNVSFRGGAAVKGASSESLSVQMMLLVEPKIRLTQRSTKVTLEECVDDQGRAIKQSQNGGSYYGGNGNLPVMIELQAPAADSLMIKHLKGKVDVAAIVRSETIELTDLAAVKDVSKTVGGRECVVKGVKVDGQQCVVTLSVAGEPMDQFNGFGAFFDDGAVKVYDDKGREISRNGSSTTGGNRRCEGTVSFRSGNDDGEAQLLVGNPCRGQHVGRSACRSTGVIFQCRGMGNRRPRCVQSFRLEASYWSSVSPSRA